MPRNAAHRIWALYLAMLGVLSLALSACVPAPPRLTASAAPQHQAPHPLDDRIWSVRDQRFITDAALIRSLSSADFVLLGELHDNPRHHALQAWVLRALVEKNRRLTLVAEMIAADQANALKIFYESPREDSRLLRLFLDWDKSGWPDWTLYAPVFDAAFRGGFAIHAGNLDRGLLPALHKSGWAALDDGQKSRLKLPRELPEAVGPALREAINAGHCGALPARVLTPFAEIQFARDAEMAQSLHENRGADGTVLIAGAEHVRKDRAVPYQLQRMNIPGRSLTLAFVETSAGQDAPADYDPALYDFIWFTPALPRSPACP